MWSALGKVWTLNWISSWAVTDDVSQVQTGMQIVTDSSSCLTYDISVSFLTMLLLHVSVTCSSDSCQNIVMDNVSNMY